MDRKLVRRGCRSPRGGNASQPAALGGGCCHGCGGRRRACVDLSSPRALADTTAPWHGSWNQNGTILFFNGLPGVVQISANGGSATPVLAGDSHPYFLPDGKRFLALNFTTTIELGALGSQETMVCASSMLSQK
jgi:hypothetical protein